MNTKRNPMKRIHKDLARLLSEESSRKNIDEVAAGKMLEEEIRRKREKRRGGRSDWVI
jgi:hypothetical protein